MKNEAIESGTVTFKVSGEFVTKHSRDLCIEGNWQEGIRFLDLSFHGIDYSIIISILKGEKAFTGMNEFELVDEKEKIKAKHLEEMEYVYGGVYRESMGNYYRPYAIVNSWGEEDFHHAMRTSPFPARDHRFYAYRSMFYAERSTDRCFVLQKNGSKSKTHVLFKVEKEIPFWMDYHKTPEESYLYFAQRKFGLKVFGYKNTFPPDPTKKVISLNKLREKKAQIEIPTVAEFLEERKKPVLPKIDYSMHSPLGWLSTNGDYYPCQYWEHRQLAGDIIEVLYNDETVSDPERFLEEKGWRKMGRDYEGNLYVFADFDKKPTKAQKDKIFDWSVIHKVKLPKEEF